MTAKSGLPLMPRILRIEFQYLCVSYFFFFFFKSFLFPLVISWGTMDMGKKMCASSSDIYSSEWKSIGELLMQENLFSYLIFSLFIAPPPWDIVMQCLNASCHFNSKRIRILNIISKCWMEMVCYYLNSSLPFHTYIELLKVFSGSFSTYGKITR